MPEAWFEVPIETSEDHGRFPKYTDSSLCTGSAGFEAAAAFVVRVYTSTQDDLDELAAKSDTTLLTKAEAATAYEYARGVPPHTDIDQMFKTI